MKTNVDTDLGTTSISFGPGMPYYTTVFTSKGQDRDRAAAGQPRLDEAGRPRLRRRDQGHDLLDPRRARRGDRPEPGLGALGPPTAPTTYRFSRSSFEQSIVGGDVQATVDREFWGWRHSLTYGGSLSRTATSRLSERTNTTLSTGDTVDAAGYPYKQFPDTTTVKAAAFVQDVATFGALRLIPAVRFDYFHLDPKSDKYFENGNAANFKIKPIDEFAISPKLGATYDLNNTWRLVAQYAHGFRAPPYDNANFAFSNPTSGYEILPNAKLRRRPATASRRGCAPASTTARACS